MVAELEIMLHCVALPWDTKTGSQFSCQTELDLPSVDEHGADRS